MAIKREACDDQFSKAVRLRDGGCLVCGNERTECAHIVGRREKSVRWDMMNAVALCHWHHRHFTENPLDFTEWLRLTLGEAHLEILREKRRHHLKTTKELRKEIAAHYRAEVKRKESDPDYEIVSWI